MPAGEGVTALPPMEAKKRMNDLLTQGGLA